MCACLPQPVSVSLLSPLPKQAHMWSCMNWHRADFLQPPGCHGNIAATPHSVSTSPILGCWHPEQKMVKNNRLASKILKTTTGSPSRWIFVKCSSFEDYLNQHTLINTHTPICIEYMCVLKFHPEAFPQIPLQPASPPDDSIHTAKTVDIEQDQ